jgi:cell division protein FtsZ
MINLDFADVRTIMTSAGSAMMGIGQGSGENRAVDAAEAAISSPLLEESITGATGVIFSVTGGSDMSLHEVNTAAEVIFNAVDPSANIIFGAGVNEELEGEIRITVIATGFKSSIRRDPVVFKKKEPLNQQVAEKKAVDDDTFFAFLDDSGDNQKPSETATTQNYVEDDIEIPAFIRQER